MKAGTNVGLLNILAVLVHCASSLDDYLRGHTGYNPISQASAEIHLPEKSLCSHFCLSSQGNCTGFIYTNHICYLYNEFCVDPQQNATDVAFVKTSADICSYIWSYNPSLALGKPASASSTHSGSPDKVNDGLVPPNEGESGAYVFSTGREEDPWWRVNMLEVYNVTAIYFLHSGYHQYWALTKNAAVTVSVLESAIFSSISRCGYIHGVVERLDNWINCTQTMRGQFAQVQLLRSSSDDGFYFGLFEVEVHGYSLSDACCWQGTE